MAQVLAAVDYGQGIEDAWSKVAAFVPMFLGFLAILLIGYLIAKSIAKFADKAIERVGFDRAVERGGVKQALAKSKYDASDIVAKVVFYALFLMVLQMAFGVFGANPVSDLITGVIAYLPKVFAAIVIVVVSAAVAHRGVDRHRRGRRVRRPQPAADRPRHRHRPLLRPARRRRRVRRHRHRRRWHPAHAGPVGERAPEVRRGAPEDPAGARRRHRVREREPRPPSREGQPLVAP